jgi:hypothetical protein
LTPETLAEAIAYRRAAIRILAKDTVKGRERAQAQQEELTLLTYGLGWKLAETDPTFDRHTFHRAAGVGT